MDLIDLTQDRDRLLAFMNIVMNLVGAKKRGAFVYEISGYQLVKKDCA